MSRGLWAAIGAFAIWGVFPLYWKQIDQVPALEIMAHRLLWCGVFVWLYLAWAQGLNWWKQHLGNRRVLLQLALSGSLIGGNWFLYIWAVNNEHIVETSLGYFINPLVNIALGTLLLQERLNRRQWTAIAIAAVGVAWLAWSYGRPPWIALALAFSFGSYGLLRKVTAIPSIPGLAIESTFLAPVALGLLLLISSQGTQHFGSAWWPQDLLLILAGVVTAVPLILFAYATRRVAYSTIGIVQYLAPSMQLMIGVLIFNEPFGQHRLIGFALIWTALLIYAADGLQRRLRRDQPAASLPEPRG